MVRSTGKRCAFLVMAVLFLTGAVSAFGEKMILGYYTTTNEPLGAPNDVYDMLDAVELGCNTIMVYNVHHPDIRQARRWLNSGALYGFKVYLELPYGAVQAGDVDTVVEYVDKFKDYPALGMWRMHDEPIGSYTPPKDVNNFLPVYAAVKTADPCHPVTCTFAQTDERLEDWIYTVDFPDIDVYPCTVSQPAP